MKKIKRLNAMSLSLVGIAITTLNVYSKDNSNNNSNSSTFIEAPMVSIPAGDFMMGSDRGRPNETPVRMVSVPAFQMGKYEVTLAEFRAFINATGYEMSNKCTHRIGKRWFGSGEKDGSWDNNIYATNEYYPVVCVSRKDAISYAKWLSEETGKHYRLPTEAEWEYTVRAGTTTRNFFDDEELSTNACQYANLSDLHASNLTEKLYDAPYNSNYTIQPCNDKEVLLSVVGTYKANPFGVHDLIGNVVERLADCYQATYENAPVDGSAVVRSDCKHYVARGGSWHWDAFASSQRMRTSDSFLAALEGFRIVLDTDGKALPSQTGSKQFVKGLTYAQKKAKKQHAKVANYPSQPTGLKVVQSSTKKVRLEWNKDDHSNITGYKVYRQDPITNNKVMLSDSVKRTAFVDKSPLSNNAIYSVSAVNKAAEGLASENVYSGIATTHTLPKKIEGEDFKAATNSYVMNSTMEPKGDRVYNSIGEEQATYQIAVSNTGQFKVDARVFHSNVPQSFEIWLGDHKLAAPTLGDKAGWETIQDILISLPKGTHTITIKGSEPHFALNWLNVKSF